MPTPQTPDISAMSLKQLAKLQVDVAARMARKLAEAEKTKAELTERAVRAIKEMATERGLPVPTAEIALRFDNGHGKSAKGSGSKRRKHAIPVKFRNPDNDKETWTGRGRRARWLVAAMAKTGKPQEHFKV